ncbi:malic enzyme-like protein [Streptomyces sp. NBC_00882]|uniref:malic enzyme-like protein n=1 Tax=Streptomyces sp. NBC_00882 TaxID=2975856 RepID=UPI00386848CB|nr:malic enzyme-like protein [Streptomyces sp. NBC_00882]
MVVETAPGPDGSLRRLTIDTDGPQTQRQLRTLLQARLGADLMHLGEPALDVAATGKVTQRLCVPAGTDRERALLDTEADHLVIERLLLEPDSIDAYTGRHRRIALISNASDVARHGRVPAPAVLPALESAAVHLRRATGLDIHPLPIAADTPKELAAAAAALAPGFAAVCLSQTHPAHAAAVRAALKPAGTPVVDTNGHAHAVATAAATVNALRYKGIPPHSACVVLAGGNRGGDLSGLLLAAGIHSLTLLDSGAGLDSLAGPADLIVDLIGLPEPSDGTLVLRADPRDVPPLHATTQRPHALHALPALLTAATRTRELTGHDLRAAVWALAQCARPGTLLPAVDDPGLVQSLTSALFADPARPTDG